MIFAAELERLTTPQKDRTNAGAANNGNPCAQPMLPRPRLRWIEPCYPAVQSLPLCEAALLPKASRDEAPGWPWERRQQDEDFGSNINFPATSECMINTFFVVIPVRRGMS